MMYTFSRNKDVVDDGDAMKMVYTMDVCDGDDILVGERREERRGEERFENKHSEKHVPVFQPIKRPYGLHTVAIRFG